MNRTTRDTDPPITVAVASRDRVYLDSLSASLGRHRLRVRPLRPDEGEPWRTLEGVDVLVLDTDSLTAADLERAGGLQRANPLVEVVAIAGDSPVADAVKALRAGVFTVLQHPVADGLLVEALVAAGRRHRHARARLEVLNGAGSSRRAGHGGAVLHATRGRGK
jgi:DNA-binding NtrC family response regulator